METKILNYFVSEEYNEENLEGIEISPVELKALKLKNLKNLNDKNCAKEMNITVKDFNQIIKLAREKLTNALVNGKAIIVKDEKEINQEDIVTTICKFRCAICGNIYTINYEKEEIICPLCLSKEVMSSEDAGFIKKEYKLKKKK